MFGGDDGMTSLLTFDIDGNSNFILGGSSLSKDLIPKVNKFEKGLLLYFENGKFLKWAKYIDDGQDRSSIVSVVKFSNDGQKIYVGL